MRSAFMAAVTSVLLLAVPVDSLRGAPGLRTQLQSQRHRLGEHSAERGALGERDGTVLVALAERERRLARDVLRVIRVGDGGGGTVSNLTVLQIEFSDSACPAFVGPNGCDAACNVVLMLWQEDAPKESVRVFINGGLLGAVEGLPADLIPGVNGVNIVRVPAGVHSFRIEAANGTSDEATITVVDEQPFSDPSISCEEGQVSGDTCDLVVTVANGGELPTNYGLFLDDALVGNVPGDATEEVIDDVAPGEHCVELVGILETEDGTYRGCFVETCCVLSCEGEICNPPVELVVCQISYGPTETDNSLLARWINGEAPYAVGVNGFVDGDLVGTLLTDPFDGSPTLAFFDGFAPGEHSVGVQGDCGEDGTSTVADAVVPVLSATPHPSPVAGNVICEWTPEDDGTTTATWTNDAPSVFIDVYLFTGANLFFVGSVQGGVEAVSVTPSNSEYLIVLQFFTSVDGVCYGSELLSCVTEPERERYIPAACNGAETPDISSGIFLLGYLFSGGPPPPCVVACDCNGDGAIDISDALCLFNFLFVGGPPPDGWVGSEPTCVEIGEGEDCGTPNPACL